MLLSACSTQRINTAHSNLLIGEWQQPNVSLKIEANGKYHYKYSADGYTNKQSCRYYTDRDSVVLYGFYPYAYTPESKNERWTIRKLTPDSLVVYVHKNTIVLDGDTLSTSDHEIEAFVKRK